MLWLERQFSYRDRSVLAPTASAGQHYVEGDSLVFVHPNGRRLSETYIAKALAGAVDASKSIPAGMKPKVTMHCLRQTAASLLVAGGTPIYDVAKILVHLDVKTTQRYAHFAPEAGRAAAETLENMLDLDREDTETDAVHDREAQDRTG